MSNTVTDREASKDPTDSSQRAIGNDTPSSSFDRGKPDKRSIVSAISQKIRSKLLTLGNPLKRLMKSKNSEEEDANRREVSPRVSERIANIGNVSGQSAAKSNTSVYRAEYLVADARTRESCQDLGSHFSEVDPDEPSTSVANTELSAGTSDRDVGRTEPNENPRSTTVTSMTSTSLGSEWTDTVSSSTNTEEVSEADFMSVLHRGTIIAVAPMTFSAQFGRERQSNDN
ncbi:uncharacterized protein LOC116851655 isoform X2 [Odontomachus brunneus]|uniref:uncharacterized protein LOC116851655 isoform X2 n=1 Tax=Odontomachus brunneus TaxID=486640 RepID=UPI0013F2076E|nr:uncharacterized protein LOC116851655 isoform X2 [Odontomachus brunneus]